MDWWLALHAGATLFLRRHGLLAACTALLIEEAGVPLPMLPGDVIMLAVGIQARQGLVSLWGAIAALELVTVIGATALYLVARRAGRDLLYRYGRYLHVTPARLAQAETWVNRHGALAVVVGRLFPGLRIATAIGCGVLGVPLPTFLPAMAAGALLYILIYTLAGYYFGPAAIAAFERVHVPLEVVGSLALLIIGLIWLIRARRALPLAADAYAAVPAGLHRRLVAGITAGATAMVGATLAMNALVPIAGDIAASVPGTLAATVGARLPSALARRGNPEVLFGGTLLFIAGGLLWGAVYGRWVARLLRRTLLPDWMKGLVFTLGPFAISVALLLTSLHRAAFGPRATAVLLGSDVLFHLAYGAILGVSFPVFLARPARRTTHRHGAPHAHAGAQAAQATHLTSGAAGPHLARPARRQPLTLWFRSKA